MECWLGEEWVVTEVKQPLRKLTPPGGRARKSVVFSLERHGFFSSPHFATHTHTLLHQSFCICAEDKTDAHLRRLRASRAIVFLVFPFLKKLLKIFNSIRKAKPLEKEQKASGKNKTEREEENHVRKQKWSRVIKSMLILG